METAPSVVDLLLLPLLLTGIGGVWYLLVWNNGRQLGRPLKGRWGGVFLILLALFVGSKTVWYLLDPTLGAIYKASLIGAGRKVLFSHYIAPIVPIVGLIVVFFLERRRKKQVLL